MLPAGRAIFQDTLKHRLKCLGTWGCAGHHHPQQRKALPASRIHFEVEAEGVDPAEVSWEPPHHSSSVDEGLTPPTPQSTAWLVA